MLLLLAVNMNFFAAHQACLIKLNLQTALSISNIFTFIYRIDYICIFCANLHKSGAQT